MITADQLLAHLVGDYLLQSDWMATEKTKRLSVALVHGLAYSLPFLALGPSLGAWAVIALSHALIDRYRIARYLVWAKEWIGPGAYWLFLRVPLGPRNRGPHAGWESRWPGAVRPVPRRALRQGIGPDKPAWLSVWLLIIADNTLHIAINGLALKYLS